MAERRQEQCILINDINLLVENLNNCNFGGDVLVISSMDILKKNSWIKSLDNSKCKYTFIDKYYLTKSYIETIISSKIGLILAIGEENLCNICGEIALEKNISSVFVCTSFCNVDINRFKPAYIVFDKKLCQEKFLDVCLITLYYKQLFLQLEKYLSFSLEKINLEILDFSHLTYKQKCALIYKLNEVNVSYNDFNLDFKIKEFTSIKFNSSNALNKVFIYQMLTNFAIKFFNKFNKHRKLIKNVDYVNLFDYKNTFFNSQELLISKSKLQLKECFEFYNNILSDKIKVLKNDFQWEFYEFFNNFSLLENPVKDFVDLFINCKSLLFFKIISFWYLDFSEN